MHVYISDERYQLRMFIRKQLTSVMALAVRNKASVKETERKGVAAPHMMMAVTRIVVIK